MNTAQEITARLRSETGYGRIFAAPDASADRWCVYEVLRKCSGGWDVPFTLGVDGRLIRGVPSSVREVRDFPTLVLVHEAPGGGYAEANVHLMLAELRKQDKWSKKGLVDDMMRQVREGRAKRRAASSQMFHDLAGEHRGLFARAAEELGL